MGTACAVQGHGVLGDRVEAEERLGPVEDVELEHRRRCRARGPARWRS